MGEQNPLGNIDLRQLKREDIERIENPALRQAVIHALVLQTVATTHSNHNSHSDHTKYTQSIKDAVIFEDILDRIFGPRVSQVNPGTK